MPKCEICGKEMANPDSLGHINSKFHQDALLGGKAVDINLEPVKVPQPAPKKEEPKPVLKKVKSNKEEPKPTPKKETKPVEVKPSEPTKEPLKPEPKKEVPKEKPKPLVMKPKQKSGGGVMDKLNKVQSKFANVGYKDIFDDITMIIGIWGFILALVGLLNNIGWIIPQAFPGFTPSTVQYLIAFANILYFIIQMVVYLTLVLFPIYIKQVGMRLVNKWPNSKLGSIIKSEKDFKNYFLMERWLIIFLFMFSAIGQWPHAVAFFAMIPVIFSETIRKRFK